MKINIFLKALLVAIIGFSLAFWFFGKSGDVLIKAGMSIFSENLSEKYKLNQSADFSGIERVVINATRSNIFIKKSATKTVKVDYSAKQASIKKIKSTLIITDNSGEDKLSGIRIFLPPTVKLVQISTVNAPQININKIKTTNLVVNAQTSDVRLDEVDVQNAKINVDSGSVHIRDANIDSAIIKSVSGEVHIRNAKVNKADIVTVSGEIHTSDIEINEGMLKTVSGELHWQGLIHHGDMETDSGEVHCRMSESFNGKFKAISGSGSIRTPKDTEGNDLLEVKTVSGDVSITR